MDRCDSVARDQIWIGSRTLSRLRRALTSSSMTGDETKPYWVDAALAEYAAHRSEVVSEAEAQQQTLGLGATAVGLVVAGAFNVWGNAVLVAVAFLGVVPLLCLFVLVQWVGRAAGLLRVGLYLERLEDALRAAYPLAPPNVFSWEKTLSATTRRGKWWKASYEWHDFGAIAIFAILAYGSIALGAYRVYARDSVVVIPLAFVEGLVFSGFAVRFLREAATARGRMRDSLEADQPAAK
jgi:hypothetical protein